MTSSTVLKPLALIETFINLQSSLQLSTKVQVTDRVMEGLIAPSLPH